MYDGGEPPPAHRGATLGSLGMQTRRANRKSPPGVPTRARPPPLAAEVRQVRDAREPAQGLGHGGPVVAEAVELEHRGRGAAARHA